jgi:predicted permease
LQDLRFALRALRHRPGFATLAVLTLALGIGATTSVYAVLRAVVLRPLPFAASDELVRVVETTPEGGDFSVSVPTFRDLRDQTRSFVRLAALLDRDVALLGQGEPIRLRGVAATAGYFELLGVRPARGTTFAAGSDQTVAVLSDRAWRTHFAGDPAVVGRAIRLDGEPVVVAGVMPPGLTSPGDPDLWLPLRLHPHAEREDHELSVVGRLDPGATRASAAAELHGLAVRLGERFPETNGGWGFRLVPLRDWMVPPVVRRTVWTLLAGAALLLVLTCANVSNLLLGRAVQRQREMGVRAALGAGRGRIARQLLTESALLALLGAAGGALLAASSMPLLRQLVPADVPGAGAIAWDPAVLLFAAAVAALAVLLFGLAPALAASASGARAAAAGLRTAGSRGHAREALVVAEVALAMTLLVGAGLLLTSFLRLRSADLGLDTAGVVAVPLAPSPQRHAGDAMGRLLLAVEERVAALPGVVAVGSSNVTPLSGFGTAIDVAAEGRPSGPGETRSARWRAVTPGFFRAAGVRLVSGRTLVAADYAADAPAVIVVTRTFARQHFADDDPLGRNVAMGVGGTNWRRIVGVVEDVQDVALAEAPQPVFFIPELGWPWMTLLVRSELDAAALAAPLRRAIWEVDPELPVPTVEAMSSRVATAVVRPRFQAQLTAAFALVALLLAAIGIYGVVSQYVAAQRREIGVRLALGATPAGIGGWVAARGARLVGIGLAAGTLAALAAGRAIAALLYATPPADPLTLLVVALLLAAVSLASVLLPARRATRVEPLAALAAE